MPLEEKSFRGFVRAVHAFLAVAVFTATAAHAQVPTTVRGLVKDAHGAPIEGAVLVSELGGHAVSARDGSFALTLDVSVSTVAFGVTAVASGQGVTSTGKALVRPSADGGDVHAGAIMLAASAGAPTCEELAWLPTFGAQLGASGGVFALTTFDDGSGDGPALYAAGDFVTAGGATVNRIAKWNGASWSPLGSGMNNEVLALTVFDDGQGGGPALYAGGRFTSAGGVVANRIAKWNGSMWSTLGSGMNSVVEVLKVFDDGSGAGPMLYAGGTFTSAGGVSVNYIAKWNGMSWSPLASVSTGGVSCLAVFDDGLGDGPALYAGGTFTAGSGIALNYIAKWNGTTWSALGSGMSGPTSSLAVFDDGLGGGPAVYAGGVFTTAGDVPASRIAKWNGTSWSPVGLGMNSSVHTLAVFDDGSGDGPALYASGPFSTADGLPATRIAKWNGTSWSPLGQGLSAWANALTVFDDGSGPALCAGGDFTTAGGVIANEIAKWDGASWSTFGSGLNGAVYAVTVFDDGLGDGPALYAGGSFTSAGVVAVSRIAKWNGTSWAPLGSGLYEGTVYALTVFDDGSGSGPALYMGGGFIIVGGEDTSRIAKWNGTSWSPVGFGLNGPVYSMAVFDEGAGARPALFAGGLFTSSAGLPTSRIAKWNGVSWSPVGGGVGGPVRALTVFDDGSGGGPALYAGGDFTTAGGVMANEIAKWNGTSWSPLGSGLEELPPNFTPSVSALAVFDDGSGGGPALYAGGDFDLAGGASANNIAKWNGTSWSPVGNGMDGQVWAMAVLDEGAGAGPALFAGGAFTSAGGAAANRIAKWNGDSWMPLGNGTAGNVHALAVFDDGSSGAMSLVAGGFFTTSPAGDSYVAKWGCAKFGPPPCATADINCDGVVDGTDLVVVLGAWGTCPESPCAADLNDDGVIDGNDLAILLGAWG